MAKNDAIRNASNAVAGNGELDIKEVFSEQVMSIVDLISEGEIERLENVYLDGTPLVNQFGHSNFSGENNEVTVVYNHGRIGQPILNDFYMSQNEVSVSTKVTTAADITRSVNNDLVTMVRITVGVESLIEYKDDGRTVGGKVELDVFINKNNITTITIEGLKRGRYFTSVLLQNLPKPPFDISIRRVTEDSKSDKIRNDTFWSSYTEIIADEPTYVNSAIAGIKIPSELFGNEPRRNYLIKGIKVEVPNNYDPVTRQYDGMWNGTFKKAWTNNPAWIYRDIVKNDRYGFGKRIKDFQIDKWELYEISRYCDVMVPDGYGGQEPRITFNAWLTDERKAGDLLSDMASTFRAIAVWDGTGITAIQDRARDPVYTYTNANVIDGVFERSYSAYKARHTAVQVEFVDKNNFYERSIAYVSDDEMIKRYGLNVSKVTAFGCTSRGQAHRMGKWILETEKLEREMISFSVGREGLMHLPGDIIEIADNHYAGTSLGGRIVAVDGRKITLDRAVDSEDGMFLSYYRDGQQQNLRVRTVADNVVTLWSDAARIEVGDVWTLTKKSVKKGLYRAISISEENGVYKISAMQHEPQKEAIVDNSAIFKPDTKTTHKPPRKVISPGAAIIDGVTTISWEEVSQSDVYSYEITLYRDGKLYGVYRNLKSPKFEIDGLPNGSYVAEIRTVFKDGRVSDPAIHRFVISTDIINLRAIPRMFSCYLEWEYPPSAGQGMSTEIWRSTANDVRTAVKMASVRYPQNSALFTGLTLSDEHYYFARLVDTKGHYGAFTQGVLGKASDDASAIVDFLNGQITDSMLSQELLKQIQDGIDEETLNDINDRIKSIKDLASRNGTAISVIENVTNQQAQQLKTVTAKADDALSGLQEEIAARAEGDEANASRINALVSNVANTEARLSDIQKTSATTNEAIARRINEISSNISHHNLIINNGFRLNDSGWSTENASYTKYYNWKNDTFSYSLGDTIVYAVRDVRRDVNELMLWIDSPTFAVSDDKIYQLSAYIAAIGIDENKDIPASVYPVFFDRAGNYIGNGEFSRDYWASKSVPDGRVVASVGLTSLSRFKRLHTNVAPPKGAVSCFFRARYYLAGADRIALITMPMACEISDISESPKDYIELNHAVGASVSSLSNTVADISGRLSATHTIRVQSIAGGRTAIAGIALGASASNNNVESSVIVMADKFGVVKNASDGMPVPMLTVIDNKVAVNGDLIANGTVLGRHIKANETINAPRITGGSLDIGGNQGRFTVNNQGAVNITSVGSGGLSITNERIEVIDARGVVRVRLGKL